MKDWLLRITLIGAAVGLSALASGLMLDVQATKAQEFNYCDFIEEQSDGQQYCGLTVEKERTSDSTTSVGGNVVFEITVTNTGTEPLTNIGVTDTFDEELLKFDDSSIEPTFGPDSGLVVWDPIDTDDDGPDTLFADESLTITVEFDAFAEAESADNCAQAFADVLPQKSSEGLSEQGDGASPDISTEFDCDDVTIVEEDGGGNGGPDPFVTPTDVPELPAPTAVPSTVPTAVPTQPGGDIGPEITAPDTGSGPGSNGGSGSFLLLGVLAAGMTVAGAGIVAAKRGR